MVREVLAVLASIPPAGLALITVAAIVIVSRRYWMRYIRRYRLRRELRSYGLGSRRR